MEISHKRILSVVNTSFVPFNPDVTTDNVAYPFGWALCMFLVMIFFIICYFNWHWRSVDNMFSEGDYRIKYEKNEVHPFFNTSSWTWFSYMINPILSMLFLLTMLIVVWVEYSSRSDGYFIRNRDAAALIATGWMGTWLFILTIIVLVDVRFKQRIAYAAHGLTGTGIDRDMANVYIEHLTSLDGVRVMGMLGSTTVSIRKAIFVTNAVFWGVLPSALMMVAIMWDRSSATTPKTFIQDTELFLIGFGGCLWTLAYYYYSFYCLKYIDTYYEPTGFDYVKDTIGKLNCNELKMIQVGFTSDTFGIRMPMRGLFPYQDLPWHFIVSRAMYTFAVGLAIYNDIEQALTLFMCVGYLPIFLSKIAGSTAYYLTYEGMSWFFFYLFSYLLQGTFYSWNDQASINFDLMTVNQSASFPGLEPSLDYGTSIYTVLGIMMATVIVSVLKTMSTPQLKQLHKTQSPETESLLKTSNSPYMYTNFKRRYNLNSG